LLIGVVGSPIFLVLHGDVRNTASAAERKSQNDVGWSAYNGGKGNEHYSPLSQINTSNVSKLNLAWRFDAGSTGGMQANPLVIGSTLYAYTSNLHVVALNAATGERLWTFDPGEEGTQPSRGFSWWSDGREDRLIAYIMNSIYAIDPKNGKIVSTFGEDGKVDLRRNLGVEDFKALSVVATSPGVVFRDLLIVGFRTSEAKPAARGDIRAYDVKTGRLQWSFHTIPHPGEPGYETWPPGAWKKAGAANNWCGMALDEKRGIVYVPTGSAASDFYGADRVGADLYANTLLALDAATGKKLWHFQVVHHDLWDRDLPSPPTLLTIKREGKIVDAIAQPTKHGFLFVLDRVSGKPVFPIEEHTFPSSDVPGEATSPTQPVPTIPAPFARQSLTEDLLTTRTQEAHDAVVKEFRTFKGGGLFVPLGVDQQTIIFPGFDGGAEWGGSAASPAGILFVNASDIPWTGALAKNGGELSPSAAIYQTQCALCHGFDRRGNPPEFPSLIDIANRMPVSRIRALVHSGVGRMPSFPNVDGENLEGLISFLEKKPSSSEVGNSPAAHVVVNQEGSRGGQLYRQNCAICHGSRREGAPSNYPALIGVRNRLPDDQIIQHIHDGKGRMPAFPQLSRAEQSALLQFLGPAASTKIAKTDDKELASKGVDVAAYRFTGYRRFLDPDGYPAVKPPWGTLNAVDLNTGQYVWRVPLGEFPELAKQGLSDTGSENYGGPIVTGGGLVFIGATVYDRMIRAFDAKTGKLLWSADLPYAGVATPATYSVNGKQFVVIATSGLRDRKGPRGVAYIAFALP
jgi:glucose dehydrogenase